MRTIGPVATVLLATAPCLLHAQQAPAPATLTVTVLDPSGAQVPSAAITVLDERGDDRASARTYVAGPDGVVAAGLPPGRYTVRVSAPGLLPVLLRAIEIRGHVRHTVRLAIAPVAETLVVTRERQDAALDPRGFSTVVSREQIEALPDDPEEFARALQALAPPGAVIRIDGFTGGIMPPKSQILSIRLPRLDSYAAQDHGGLDGLGYIEIVTTPGGGRVQGSADMTLRHHALNARNPLASEEARGSARAWTMTLDGPIVAERASFAVSGRVLQAQDATALRAVLPDGRLRSDPVVRPTQRLSLTGRLTVALGGGHVLRAAVSGSRGRSGNLGVGGLNLPDRAFHSSSREATVRASSGGPLGRRAFLETRLQVRRTATRSTPVVEAPTVRVLDAFTSGGAQVRGGTRALAIEGATDLDYVRGAHAWRFGTLVEASRHHTNRRTNDLGTFTFASLAHYRAGAPASFTRRVGDPEVAYGNLQVGLYAQDDYRAARSVLLSYGVRYERQTAAGAGGRLLPRGGITWSPWRSGVTTLRAGGGLFSDWLPMQVYEQTLLLDGTRQHDLLVLSPGYPDPPRSGVPGAGLPQERYLLDTRLRLPSSLVVSAGIEQQLGAGLRLQAGYARRIGWHLLRGRNLNAPVEGIRSDASRGNVVEVTSDAGMRGDTATVQLATTNFARPWSLTAVYVLTRMTSNTAGAFALPPSGRLGDDWGPIAPTHALSGAFTVRVAGRVSIALQPQWRSGAPYTVTSGRDDNGDGLFTDRPAGLARNSDRTPAYWDLGARVSCVVGPGGIRRAAPVNDGAARRAGADDGQDPRYRVELFVSAQNVTNRPNYVAVGSVMGAPLFGQPTAAINPRRLDVGVRLGF